jgi:phosphate transport system permease protein
MAFEGAVGVAGVLAILIVILIFVFLLRDALPLLKSASLVELLTGREWYPNDGRFGFLPLILGSALVTAGAVAIAVPIGVAAAVYIGELAPARAREILKPAVEMMAAIPSVVVGFIGLVVIGPLLQKWFNLNSGTVALTGSVMLAFMAMPTIVTIAEDALATVPKEHRSGSLALGATAWQTIWRVQLPAARSGIVAAVMLGVGRAIGETMTVLMVTGNAFAQTRMVDGHAVAVMPYTLFQSVRTMTATIAAEMGETAQYSPHYSALFLLGVVLFAITFLINLAADVALHRANRHAK